MVYLCIQIQPTRSQTDSEGQKSRVRSRAPRQEFLTHSSMSEIKKQPSTDSGSNPWESLGSPTLLWSPTSGVPLQDGLYTDARFPVQNMAIQTNVVWKRPKVSQSDSTAHSSRQPYDYISCTYLYVKQHSDLFFPNLVYKNVVGMLFLNVSKTLKCPGFLS